MCLLISPRYIYTVVEFLPSGTLSRTEHSCCRLQIPRFYVRREGSAPLLQNGSRNDQFPQSRFLGLANAYVRENRHCGSASEWHILDFVRILIAQIIASDKHSRASFATGSVLRQAGQSLCAPCCASAEFYVCLWSLW